MAAIRYIEDEQEIRIYDAKQVIEQAIFPAMFLHVFNTNVKCRPESVSDYKESIALTEQYLGEVLLSSDRGKLESRSRHLHKLNKSMFNYFADNKFDTRKILICCVDVILFLLANDLLEVPEDSSFYIILCDMQQLLECGCDEVEDFDKIEKSALKKSSKVLEELQKHGYFGFEVEEAG